MRSVWVVLASVLLVGAAPSRTKTYTAGQVISPTDVTENEDNIYSYLQAGPDTFRTGAITATALASGSVDTDELAANAVTGAKVLDGTLTPADLSGSPADDTVYVADSSSAGTWRSVPSCSDSSGQHLNYTTASNSFSCGTSTNAPVVGTFTRNEATGSSTVTISGLGITPKLVWVFCSESGGIGETSWGFSDGTTNVSVFDDYGVSANTMNTDTNAIEIREGPTSSTSVTATIGNFTSGQFDVVYTRNGSPTGTFTCRYTALP